MSEIIQVDNQESISVVGKLSLLDKFLPVWILIAMFVGFVLGYSDRIIDFFNAVQFGTTSLPIAIGLLWMMYPVLAKVKYEEMRSGTGEGVIDKSLFGTSLILNWIIGPFLMFGLAWIFLGDEPGFREGLIIVGLARCIAMVLIWNMLAGGDNEDAAMLVAINSIFQVLAYSIYAYFFLSVLPSWLGADTSEIDVSMGDIATSVFIFLGIPLIAGMITRYIGLKRIGKEKYDNEFAKKLGPTAIIGLLFTIIVMFAMQGRQIIELQFTLVKVITPLLLYFFLMFSISFVIAWALKFAYDKTVTLSFTAASNNFELAIAVAIGTYGIESEQAVSTVIGPLIEVPVLIGLVYFSIYLKKIMFNVDGSPKSRNR